MKTDWRKHAPLLILAVGILLTGLTYFPGLSGPWLVDDDANLGIFKNFPAGSAPYGDIVFNNNSGPLGRPVSMASFAVNHALDLFSTPALKATNLLIHVGNGLLLFMLLSRLFRLKPPTTNPVLSSTLAAIITGWWLLLPLHLSSVLYIVQRMTLLASFFSLASCLTYVIGRDMLAANRRIGVPVISTSLVILFPLAILAKESAFITLAWLVLIELFFFRKSPVWHIGLRPALVTLVIFTVLTGVLLVLLLPIQEQYLWREFTLAERLLTQSRVVWSYINDIFIPNSHRMGVFQDDYPVSRGLLAPWSTLAGLAGLAGMLAIAIKLAASRWWAVSFGILFYLSGHLVESTIVSLELYFEHRNYLPSAGLLLASASAITMLWPWRQALLAIVFSIYLLTLTFSTFQRSNIWANKSLLLETSAQNHPLSLRAWTDYPEDLLENRKPRLALEAALHGAQTNPGYASISLIQMISIYCRIQHPAPPYLIDQTALALEANTNLASRITTPLGIGLELILTQHQEGNCKQTDFTPLAPAFVRLDNQLRQHYGPQRHGLWFLRLTLAEWLLELDQPQSALPILQDIWQTGAQGVIPTVGLVLARTLIQTNALPEARQVLAELTVVTHDAPEDFRAEMASLQQRASGSR